MKKTRLVYLMMVLCLMSLCQIFSQSSLAASGVLTSNVGTQYVSLAESPTGKYLITVNLRPSGYTPYQKATFYFYFNGSPGGWLVNIGDSSSNNGYAGDSGTQSNDSELQIVNGSMAIYASDYGSSQTLLTRTGCAPANNCIRVEVSNNKVSYYNYATGEGFTYTSPYIFALNGQADAEGPVNYTIYAALNRVIDGTYDRVGTGLVRTTVFLSADTTAMNVYYGFLHAHTSYSDGVGTPANAFDYAKTTGQLNFMGLADHSQSLTAAEWTDTLTQADYYTTDGQFVGLRGFEWSSNTYGHVTVNNTVDFCSHTNTSYDTFEELVSWLSSRDCIAIFNHPQVTWVNRALEFGNFNGTKSDKFVAMECWNHSDDCWNNDGFVPGDGLNYFGEAITRGWYLGTAGAQDNHDWTWGNKNNYRTGVWARNLTRPDILEAFKARRIFTTWDKNLALSVKLNGYDMGSKLSPGNYTMTISAKDSDGELITAIEIYSNGQRIPVSFPYSPSSNFTVAVPGISAMRGNNIYVIVREADGDKAISSPIFIQ